MNLKSAGAALAALLAVSPAYAQTASKGPELRPLRELPYTPSLDLGSMDRSVDPCVDFYHYACGGWLQKNPIPPDRSRWGVYGKLYSDNQQFVWGLLEAAAQPDAPRDASTTLIGDAFAACMDEPAVEKAGAAPIQADLAAIDALGSLAGLPALLGNLHGSYEGDGLLFGFGPGQDFTDSSRVIGFLDSGGLGLPDRDYYVKGDARSRDVRGRYRAHVARMLELAGTPAAEAKEGGETVLRMETALARASLARVDRRNPQNLHHAMSLQEAQALTPSFPWKPYLEALGAPPLTRLNVSEPAFFKEMEALLKQEPLADWKAYLRWHVVDLRAPYLSRAFVEADFDFYRRYLLGTPEMEPRWKRCAGLVDRDLGDALGQVFVKKVFPPEVKQQALAMVREIEKAMERRLRALPWMSEATRKEALGKLHAMRNKIGYPDRWRDYAGLEVRRGDFAGNVARSLRFETRRQLAKIGKPVDREEWVTTVPTVNAFYNDQNNDMNFPAGVLLPPLFDPRMDAAPNYGNTGGTIGHELIHGFDDSGRRFDAGGNLRDWWTAQDAREFEKRVACVAGQYAQYTIVDDIKINSRLTLGEDVADLGGTLLAYEAWREATRDARLQPLDGLTPDQRFFVGFAQWACGHERPESRRNSALTNLHSPPEFRINGVLSNLEAFRDAFACKAGQPMVKEPACEVW